jgi:hypothetical protein
MLFRDRPSNLFDDAKSKDAHEDQIERDDVVQKARHDQNKNAGNERDDGLKVAKGDGHGFSPYHDGDEIRIATNPSSGTGILDGSTRRMFRACKNFRR